MRTKHLRWQKRENGYWRNNKMDHQIVVRGGVRDLKVLLLACRLDRELSPSLASLAT